MGPLNCSYGKIRKIKFINNAFTYVIRDIIFRKKIVEKKALLLVCSCGKVDANQMGEHYCSKKKHDHLCHERYNFL